MRTYRLVSPHPHQYLRDALSARGWAETPGPEWDLLWSDRIPPPLVYRSRRPGTLVNHLPGAVTLHYKDELAHFLAAAGADFHPRTYAMPFDRGRWEAAAAADPEAIWIVKPKRDARGRRIRLGRGAGRVAPADDEIVQRYVAHPLLLPGDPHKHVLRVYLLVTSLDPLTAWVHPRGPVKFASRPFSTTGAGLADRLRHLTNPGLHDAPRTITMADYAARFTAAGHDFSSLWRTICRCLAATLAAHSEAMLRVSRYVAGRDLAGLFELLGCDVLVDAEARPWLLECNISPRLAARGAAGSAGAAAQEATKRAVVADVVGLVDDGAAGEFVPL